MCVWVWKCAFHLSVCVCVGGNKSKAPEPLDWRGFITVTTQTTSTGSIVLLAGYLTEGGGYGPGVFYLPATNKLTLLVLLSFTVVVGAINKISHKPRSGNGSISQALNSTTPPSRLSSKGGLSGCVVSGCTNKSPLISPTDHYSFKKLCWCPVFSLGLMTRTQQEYGLELWPNPNQSWAENNLLRVYSAICACVWPLSAAWDQRATDLTEKIILFVTIMLLLAFISFNYNSLLNLWTEQYRYNERPGYVQKELV